MEPISVVDFRKVDPKKQDLAALSHPEQTRSSRKSARPSALAISYYVVKLT